ncbi:MAG: hypothetical protein R3D70_03725 [Rhizobiaceae bacterium]
MIHELQNPQIWVTQDDISRKHIACWMRDANHAQSSTAPHFRAGGTSELTAATNHTGA